MQGAEERRELRDASCSEPAHVVLAELGALIVMNLAFFVLSSVSCGMDTEVSRLPARCKPATKCARGITRRNMGQPDFGPRGLRLSLNRLGQLGDGWDYEAV